MSHDILTLGEVLSEHARSRPDRTAVVCGAHRASWAQMDERVEWAARALAGRGVVPGDPVLWLGQNCHRLYELILAAARIGAICTAANWRSSAEELAFVIDDVEAKVVCWQETEIGETVRAARASAVHQDAPWIRTDGTDGRVEYEAFLTEGEPAAYAEPWPPVDATAPVTMIYTAAFDGVPNGALLSHRAWTLQNLLTALAGGNTPGDVFLCSGPLFHVGTMRRLLALFQLGACNVITRRVDPEELCQLIDRERCTRAFLEKPTIEAIVELNRDGRYDLSSLKVEPGSPEWNAMVTPTAPPLRNGFGQTELTGIASFSDPSDPGIGISGRPSPIAQFEIVDPDGRAVLAGETGEIVVRGPLVMNGYHRRPELNVWRSRGGWHHTNDLGRRESDGTLTFVGPASRIVKSASENIYPAEVEGCLRSHPAVREVAVIGVPDQVWSQLVLAVVVPHDGQTITLDEVVEHCRSRIASYKKPKLLEIAEALPRTGSGAVDYDALDERYGGGGYPSK